MRITLLSLLFSTCFVLMPPNAEAQTVDILWEGQSYTPPFYQGLALWPNEGQVAVSAIAIIPGKSSASLYYRWSKDGTVLGSLSGVGKNSITFSDTILSLPIEVRVDVRDGEEGDILATERVTLSPSDPEILVVEDSPLYGLMLNKAVLNNFSLINSEVSFSAIPLFHRTTTKNAPAISYLWSTNTGDARTGNRVTYRISDDSSGQAKIQLSITNKGVLVQPQPKNFNIMFNQNNGL